MRRVAANTAEWLHLPQAALWHAPCKRAGKLPQTGKAYMRNITVIRRRLSSPVALAVAGLAAMVLGSATPRTASLQPLIQPTNLVYQGAFRLPTGTFGGSSFSYGGTALAYNSARDSLFMIGHDWQQMAAEVSIPAIRQDPNLTGLATATVLQPFTDPTEGLKPTVGSGTAKIGGLYVQGTQLFGTVYLYYDGLGTQSVSHFVRPVSFSSTGSVRGIYKVGSVGAGSVAGWIIPVPASWQTALGGTALTGQCCIPVIGRSSSGPAAFVFEPSDLGKQTTTPATPLLYYPLTNPLAPWGATGQLFNGAVEVGGAVFPEGARSVLFLGRVGMGPFCYGLGTDCNDPAILSKGNHAYPYEYQVWAYDALDLAAVKSGKKQSYDVKPYATWQVSLPFSDLPHDAGGVAYDPSGSRIFFAARSADGTGPLIHVFHIENLPVSAAPQPPENVRIIR